MANRTYRVIQTITKTINIEVTEDFGEKAAKKLAKEYAIAFYFVPGVEAVVETFTYKVKKV